VGELKVASIDEFPPGSVKIVGTASITVGVYNCGGDLLAIEDRCSHDDGPLCEGDWEPEDCRVICPRHGSAFDLRTGRPLSLPAYEPVDTFPVRVDDDGIVRVEIP
jgi:3-phenylpropionate/trans-cinnamate dioxygenase ferredoxin subunit